MKEYLLPLKEKQMVAEDTVSLWFDISNTDFSFKAGQYSAFTLGDETKVFTLASSPHHKDFMAITTRMRPTGFKEKLRALPLGTKIKVSPPRGRFILPEILETPLVFIAGGIGVTPFRSMIEWVTHEKNPYPITLFYSNRTFALTAYLKEFQEWERQNPNFKLVATLTQESPSQWLCEKGRIDAKMIQKYVPQIGSFIHYIAGPPKMVEGMTQTLLGLNISKENIKTEKFSGY